MLWLAAVLLVATGPEATRLDQMFSELRTAPTEQAAAALEGAIEQSWQRAGSAAVRLLMSRGARDFQAGNDDEALADFSDAITLDPSLTEGWHRRAMVRAHAGDAPGAIADIQAALVREPRQFAALRTLSLIAERRQDWRGALAAWTKVLAIDPNTPGGIARRKDLERRALGETL